VNIAKLSQLLRQAASRHRKTRYHSAAQVGAAPWTGRYDMFGYRVASLGVLLVTAPPPREPQLKIVCGKHDPS
jgi:hypothetical protein